MSELIERLRESAGRHARGVETPGEITCPRALADPKNTRSKDQHEVCRSTHDGHLCWWTDSMTHGTFHRTVRHKCRCGVYWGKGDDL